MGKLTDDDAPVQVGNEVAEEPRTLEDRIRRFRTKEEIARLGRQVADERIVREEGSLSRQLDPLRDVEGRVAAAVDVLGGRHEEEDACGEQ